MNERMQEICYERVTDARAREIYEALVDICDLREGGCTDADQLMIGDIAYLEQVKQMLQDDIAERGIGQERYNGRQKYYQKNESVAQFRAYCDQQSKLLGRLRLTAEGRKAEQLSLGDDFDAFD